MNIQQQARIIGYDSASNGCQFFDNPYDFETTAYEEWRDGWDEYFETVYGMYDTNCDYAHEQTH